MCKFHFQTKRWIIEYWNNVFLNHSNLGWSGETLIADLHNAQKTNDTKILSEKDFTGLAKLWRSARCLYKQRNF